MNENINLCKILKDCPKGTRFWSKIHGDVFFEEIINDDKIAIKVVAFNKFRQRNIVYFSSRGYFDESYNNAEIVLVPSKTQQDWSKWKCPKPKFDPKTLKAFDKVIVKPDNGDWHCSILSHRDEHNFYYRTIDGYGYPNIVPYNDETKHLVGTSDEAPEFYRYWED